MQLRIRLVGYFHSTSGVGENARLFRPIIESIVGPVECLPFDEFIDYRVPGAPIPDVEIIFLNPAELRTYLLQTADSPNRPYRIGYWWWELDELPPNWADAFAWVDEIWVGSSAVLHAVTKAASGRAFVIPPPIKMEPSQAVDALPDAFRFLTVFDYQSVPERKNPMGAVTAFCRAFAKNEGPVLLVKSVHGDVHPTKRDALQAMGGDRTDIIFINRPLPAAQQRGLIAASQCVVSLHRAEGFGLVLAEALLMGKPVIASAVGGVLDFLSNDTAYLVPARPSPIPAGCTPYPEGATWAEPDVDAAAEAMRAVFKDQGGALAKATMGQTRLPAILGPGVTAAKATARLAAIAAGIDSPQRRATQDPRPTAYESLLFSPQSRHLIRRLRDHPTLRRWGHRIRPWIRGGLGK